MVSLELLRKIEGKQTVETVSEILGINRQSTINLLSKLRKEGYIAVSGGGRQKRIYDITRRKKREKEYQGMFDILNKYAKNKIAPPFIHEPHNKYGVENALIDLLELNDLRIPINMLPLFNHIKNWSLVSSLAKKQGVRRKIGALYDAARTVTKVRKMPENMRKSFLKSNDKAGFTRSSGDFPEIESVWNVKIPFNKKDLEVYK